MGGEPVIELLGDDVYANSFMGGQKDIKTVVSHINADQKVILQ